MSVYYKQFEIIPNSENLFPVIVKGLRCPLRFEYQGLVQAPSNPNHDHTPRIETFEDAIEYVKELIDREAITLIPHESQGTSTPFKVNVTSDINQLFFTKE